MNRRSLIKQLSIGAGSVTIPSIITAQAANQIKKQEEIIITKVEGIRFSNKIKIGGGSGGSDETEFCWVRLTTNTGIEGVGETYPFTNGELGALKDYAHLLIGSDPRNIDGTWQKLFHDMSMRNAGGADMRIISAINMAQLDLLGKILNVPAYRLLGGKTRDKIKVYNTVTDYWSINNMKMGRDTEKIVKFLMDRKIFGMKIYPFEAKDEMITTAEIDQCIQWLKQIRDTAGNKMEILIDCWGRFDLTSSQRILKAIEPYNVIHMEDMMVPSNAQQGYAALAAETPVPIAHSETIATRFEIKDFLEKRALDILMFDICWCGGPTEAKKMCDMADAFNIPGSPHTAGGPLLWLSSIHLCTAITNFCYMESNYWKYTHQFPYFLNNVPVPVDGYVSAPEAPGLGADIKPELFRNGDAIVEVIAQR